MKTFIKANIKKSDGQTNKRIKKAYNQYVSNGHTDFLVMARELLCYLKGIKLLKE